MNNPEATHNYVHCYIKDLTMRLYRDGNVIVEWSNGDKYWFAKGILHRLDGPAVEYASGEKSWYLSGKRVSCSTQKEFKKFLKLKAFW